MKKGLTFLCGFIIIVTFQSCGYSTKSALPPNLKTIYIAPIENNIDYARSTSRRELYIPLLEVEIRNAVINRFQFDGYLRIAREEEADLVIRGELTNYNRGELRTTDTDETEEYRIYVTGKFECYDRHMNNLRWNEPSITGEATYFVIGPLATTEASAINEAVTDLARRIVERTVEDW